MDVVAIKLVECTILFILCDYFNIVSTKVYYPTFYVTSLWLVSNTSICVQVDIGVQQVDQLFVSCHASPCTHHTKLQINRSESFVTDELATKEQLWGLLLGAESLHPISSFPDAHACTPHHSSTLQNLIIRAGAVSSEAGVLYHQGRGAVEAGVL